MTADDGELSIEVHIDPTAEPIRGVVRNHGGDGTAFVGYAHLVAQIERHRDLARPPGSDENPRPPAV